METEKLTEELIKECEENGGHYLKVRDGDSGFMMTNWVCIKCPYTEDDW